jgi:hypothetical protein
MKKKRLQNIVSITQILSSLAVLVSIILLITEYKRSGILNEKSVENLVYSRIMELDRLIIENEDFAEIITKAYSFPDSLSKNERIRYLAYEHIFFDSWETLWVGYKDGLVEESTWIEWNDWFLSEAKKKPELAMIGNVNNFSPEFIKYIRKGMKTEN